MKVRTLNPLKIISKRGKNKFDDETSVAESSASFSIDGSNHIKKNSGSIGALVAVNFDESCNIVHECSHSMSEEEMINELWYSSQETAHKKSNA